VLTIAFLPVVCPFLIKNIVSEQSNLVLCLQKILLKYIAQERPLLISFPATTNDTVQTSPRTDNLQLVGSLLQSINMVNIWPVYVYQLDIDTHSNTSVTLHYKPHSYVIFIGPGKDEILLYDTLVSQINILSSDIYFNPRGRFIFVVTGYRLETNNFLFCSNRTLWINFRLEHFIIVIADPEPYHYNTNEDVYGLVESNNFDMYS
jgi:hypothetical protein